jgi:hypothetical protein
VAVPERPGDPSAHAVADYVRPNGTEAIPYRLFQLQRPLRLDHAAQRACVEADADGDR